MSGQSEKTFRQFSGLISFLIHGKNSVEFKGFIVFLVDSSAENSPLWILCQIIAKGHNSLNTLV